MRCNCLVAGALVSTSSTVANFDRDQGRVRGRLESNGNGELLVAAAKSDYPRVVGLRYHRGVYTDYAPPLPAIPPHAAAASITIEIQTPTLVITIGKSTTYWEPAGPPLQNRGFVCFSKWVGISIEFTSLTTAGTVVAITR